MQKHCYLSVNRALDLFKEKNITLFELNNCTCRKNGGFWNLCPVSAPTQGTKPKNFSDWPSTENSCGRMLWSKRAAGIILDWKGLTLKKFAICCSLSFFYQLSKIWANEKTFDFRVQWLFIRRMRSVENLEEETQGECLEDIE